ncbi:beta-lactamase family protein [Aquibacillus koreensis]|uniref:Beta-lactamase family protein n=1 Tax=Aquibacillus koreensis TaxID=279446 RepID=A0A9X3WNH4_9BACI|nr:serine hydrolase domain-containing protein [Aquibacillus koreensis]MCT2536028.1 beta-lactamase family protein [Aquibacillus koreensis]MDC3420484.1 beta-lactamase family protein [Aquibacillus koreensis]
MKEKIEALLKANYDLNYFIGNVLVAKGDQVIVNQNYGMVDYENNIPHTPTSKFLVGSISKQFVATAIMKLQEEGQLHVTDKISDYIAHYPHASQITIHQLLSHSAGIPNYTETLEYIQNKDKVHSPEDIIDLFREKELLFEPGSSCSYSNSGYVLLARIIEKVTGLPYATYLEQTIFQPLHMDNTGVLMDGTNIDSPMVGYSGTMNGYKAGPSWNLSLLYGAGGIYSTVEDLYKWDRALYTDKVLSLKSRSELLKQHIGNFGYGWFVNEDGVNHDGRLTGFNSLISRYMKEDLVIIILSNRVYYGQRLPMINQDILSLLNGKEITLPSKVEQREAHHLNKDTYIGQYIEPNVKLPFSIKYEEQRYFFYDESNPDYKSELKPVKQTDHEDTFAVGMSPGMVTFKKNQQAEVTHATLTEDGFVISLEKSN